MVTADSRLEDFELMRAVILMLAETPGTMAHARAHADDAREPATATDTE